MDYTVNGILQVRILEWLSFPFSRGYSQLRDLPHCRHILYKLSHEERYAQYIMRNTGLEEAQAGIKIPRRNINNLRYADDTTLMAESEEELKSLLMKVKEESEKIWLKTQHSKN